MTPEQIKALRDQGLISAEVTDEAVLAAVAPAPADNGNDDTEDTATAGQAGDVADEVETAQPIAASKAAKAPEAPETVQMSAAQFADMQKRLTAAEATLAANKKAETQRRHDKIIASAKETGRLHPNDEEGWRKMLSKDEEQASTLLASLQPFVHTTEIGSATASYAVGTAEAVLQEQMKIDAEALNGAK